MYLMPPVLCPASQTMRGDVPTVCQRPVKPVAEQTFANPFRTASSFIAKPHSFSLAIAEIEHEYDVKLFDRTT